MSKSKKSKRNLPTEERPAEKMPSAEAPEEVISEEILEEFSAEEEAPIETAGAEKKGGWFKELLMIFLLAVVLAVAVKTFLVDTRMIPSGSMLPTIEIGERVLVDKLSHILGKTPERGDIVVFSAPDELNEKSDLIKRVIGLPGETVEIKNGMVYIDGEPLSEDYLNEAPSYTYGPTVVPAGHYFMLGDNRNHSADSHRWHDPFVSFDDIRGKAFFCYWPLDQIGGLK